MKKTGAILGSVLAIGLLLFSINWLYGNRQFSKTGIQVQGRVVELVEQGSSGRTIDYFPVVEFPLQTGENKRLQLSISSDNYEVGDAIQLIYDQQNPDIVTTADGSGLYLFPSLGIVFSLVLLVICLSSLKNPGVS